MNQKKQIKPRAGFKFYKGIQVPENSEILISPLGREYYISGSTMTHHTIKFIDDGKYFVIKNK